MNCKQKENLESCPCTYPDCSRKGICCECIKYHIKKKQLPACCFPTKIETTFDRSIKKFIECQKNII